MAPRRTGRGKTAALSTIDTNASTAMTPRRAEVSALKDENEALKSQMANLTETLAKMGMKEDSVAAAPAVTAPVVAAPTLSVIQAPKFPMPPAPTKPTTAYSLFCASIRPTMAGMKVPEQAKAMGAMWKELTEEKRKPFTGAAASERNRYDVDMKRHNAQVAKIQLENDALTMMYDARKKDHALAFYEQQMAAAAAGLPLAPVQKRADKKDAEPKRIAPKKARTAYMLFAADRREAMANKTKDGEKTPHGEVMKKISEDWAKLENTKTGKKTLKKYADLHTADKVRYAQEMETYTAAEEQDAVAARAVAARQLAADKKEAMKVFAPQVRQAAAARETEAAAKEDKKARKAARAGEPKRAKSAYIFFTLGERAGVVAAMPDANQAMVMAELGRRWKQAGEEQRAKYVAEAEEDKTRYADEMAAFKKE